MFRVIATPEWSCNFYDYQKRAPLGANCQYCTLYADSKNPTFAILGEKKLSLGKQMTAREWANGAERVADSIGEDLLFDFTGGEPTLYKELPEMLHLVKDCSQWAMTSNSSLRPRIEAIFAADIKPCKSWTGSWHPNTGKIIESFIDNLNFIKSHGVCTSATLVLHSSTKHRIRQDLIRLAEAGITTQLHYFLAPDYTVADETDQEMLELYDELRELNRSPAESWVQDAPNLPHSKTCTAGYRSAAVSSDGNVFGCYKAMMIEPDPPIGQWGEWTPNADLTRDCTWSCIYPCDLRSTISSHYVAIL